MPTPPLVFVGTATHDTIARVDRYPEPDERMIVDDLVVAGGGPAATAAVAASRLGRQVAFVGSVGDDAVGDAIVAGLRAEGVDTSGVRRRCGARSATSVVIVSAEKATRAILHRPSDAIEISDTGWALIGGAEWVHVDHAGWPIVDRWWRSRTVRPRLSVDAGNPVATIALDGIDLFVPTVTDLRRRYGTMPTAGLLRRAVSDGARLVVATDGERGATVLGASEASFHVPALTGAVHSTLGAGDVFHGALLAAIDRGRPIRQAVEYATVVAFASCRGLDGRSAIPDDATAMAVVASREVAR